MRYLRANWEGIVAGALFLFSAYAAVFYVLNGAFGAAGFALFCAWGFFQALMAFIDHATMRRLMRRDQRSEKVEG